MTCISRYVMLLLPLLLVDATKEVDGLFIDDDSACSFFGVVLVSGDDSMVFRYVPLPVTLPHLSVKVKSRW